MPRSRLVTITTAAGLTLGCGGLFGEPDITNPPPPQPSATLFVNDDGTCLVEHSFQCPPPEEGMTCNPPPPLEVDCPPLHTTHEITRQPDGSCQAAGSMECPPDWSCPSSATVTLDCPPELGEADSIAQNYPYGCVTMTGDVRALTLDCPSSMNRALPSDYRVEANGDGTCTAWYTGDINCPEGASCNPPPPADVPCPPEEPERPIKVNPPPPG